MIIDNAFVRIRSKNSCCICSILASSLALTDGPEVIFRQRLADFQAAPFPGRGGGAKATAPQPIPRAALRTPASFPLKGGEAASRPGAHVRRDTPRALSRSQPPA